MTKSLHAQEYKHLLAELRAAREGAGLTQLELAQRMGEHQTYVSKCELGVRRLDVLELRRWTKALGLGFVSFVDQLDERLDRHAAPRLGRPRRRNETA